MVLILSIEDSLLSRRAIAKSLRGKGYDLMEASSGQQGIEMAALHQPDCILLDLLMPDMDGREVLKILQQRGLDIPVIVVTADIQHTSRQECLDLGARAVLRKLPNAEELCEAIAIALTTPEGVAR